jgi:uncharacterized protein (DUF488 family)
MTKSVELLTAGYEGEELQDFVRKLTDAGVERVIDVRFTPLSRKRGFSKTPLSEALKVAGIEYVHYKELGTLKSIREAYKETGDFAAFRRKYDAYLNDHTQPMAMVYRLAATKRSALLCYEADPAHCHRTILAERLSRDFHGDYTLTITHLPSVAVAKVRPPRAKNAAG